MVVKLLQFLAIPLERICSSCLQIAQFRVAKVHLWVHPLLAFPPLPLKSFCGSEKLRSV